MDHATDAPANRLMTESSPYLRQHARNPVDWYPWSSAAIEKARNEDKPLLVSIGYSTCHWCHVMADESFSDPDTAAVMNRDFVCVKVDREERPDIDTLYITAVNAMAGSAGWPLHVFLDPETLNPFFGGTYFPPKSRFGMASWTDLLKKIAAAWHRPNEREKLRETAVAVDRFLSERLGGVGVEKAEVQPLAPLLARAVDAFAGIYDSDRGGFGNAPKFPMPAILQFLLALADANGKNAAKAREMAVHTLTAMAAGGIYDQIGGGFHRYSTDGKWHLPHFEKMLYDNAQLVTVLADACRLIKNAELLRVAEETADYILRDMTHPDGGFYSAEDADSPIPQNPTKHAEGAFYVWTADEMHQVLGPDTAAVVSLRFGVRPEGNVDTDPHGEFNGKNIVFQAKTVAETAAAIGITTAEAADMVDAGKKALMAHRATRPRPNLDDKVITAWNGLMISGLARLARVSPAPRYRAAAEKAARFILNNLAGEGAGPENGLNRIWRDGKSRIPGLAEDYAFLVLGLLDLYEVKSDSQWLTAAVDFTDTMLALFVDGQTGAVYQTREGHDPHIRLRVREETDNVLPAPGSVVALNLIRLHRHTGRKDYKTMAEKIIHAVMPAISRHPMVAPVMLTAAMMLDKNSV